MSRSLDFSRGCGIFAVGGSSHLLSKIFRFSLSKVVRKWNSRLAALKAFVSYASACYPEYIALSAELSAIKAQKNDPFFKVAYMSEEAVRVLLAQPTMADLQFQMKRYLRRANRLPMAVLGWKSPVQIRLPHGTLSFLGPTSLTNEQSGKIFALIGDEKGVFLPISIRKVAHIRHDDPGAPLVFAAFFRRNGGPNRPALRISGCFAN